MAYVSQEKKKALAPAIKKVLKAYNMKGTLSIYNHSTLCCTLKAGSIDFDVSELDTYEAVNVYHIDKHYTGRAQKFLNDLLAAMKGDDWYDKSDIQTVYFDISHYCDISIGSYKKPYQLQVA